MLRSLLAAWQARCPRSPVVRTRPSRRFRPVLDRLEQRDVPTLAVWTAYVPQYGDRVDALIRQLAPGTRDPVVFFRNVNAWLATSIAPRVPAWVNVNVYLTQLAGDCTVRAHVMQAVAQRLRVPVQIVILSNVPYQGLHMTVQISSRGRWYFFDPSSGGYLAARERPGLPLGLTLARHLGRTRTVVMLSTSSLFRGLWSTQRVFAYRPATSNLVLWQGRRAFDLTATYYVAPALPHGPDPLP